MNIVVTPLRRFPSEKGEVRHAMKSIDPGYVGFGEAYITEVLDYAVKGWRRHKVMTLNLIVVRGAIRFVIHDGTEFEVVDLSPDGEAPYARLTVPPGVWMAFQGCRSGSNLVLNLASVIHDPGESDVLDLASFPYEFDHA